MRKNTTKQASAKPIPLAVRRHGYKYLDEVTGATNWLREARSGRDYAVMEAFNHGHTGAEIAEAAGLSLAGVYRIRERRSGHNPPSRVKVDERE